MSEIIPNSYSLQINWDEKYAVTLCARPGCGAELRTQKFHVQRDTVQRWHDEECHRVSATKLVGKTTYVFNDYADDVKTGQLELELSIDSKLATLCKHKKFQSSDYLKNSRKPWKRPPDKKELYAPTGLMVGATVDFVSKMTSITLSAWPDYKTRTIDEKKFTGVVWSDTGAVPNSMWVLCDNGMCYLVSKKDLTVLWSKDPRGAESKEWLDLIREDSAS